MKLNDKIVYLEEKHFSEWHKARHECENDLSDKQSMFCVCGKLATGLHEGNCPKFRKKVLSNTVEKLAHLLNQNTTGPIGLEKEE